MRKSLFDPCPPGWQVPTSSSSNPSIVDDFVISNTTPSSYVNGFYNARGLYYYGPYGIGCYYWPEIKKDSDTPAPVDGIIFHPATGYMDGVSFKGITTESSLSNGRWWLNMRASVSSSSSIGNAYSYITNFNSTAEGQPNCTISSSMKRSSGHSVRCIKSPVIPEGQ